MKALIILSLTLLSLNSFAGTATVGENKSADAGCAKLKSAEARVTKAAIVDNKQGDDKKKPVKDAQK